MEHVRGAGRGSYIWGRSVHNVRIERLWVDVSNYISQDWNNFFTRLDGHHLDTSNQNHIWLLQHLFLEAINNSLAFWAEGWNSHRITQGRDSNGPNRSPEDMWGFDMLVHGMRGDSLDQHRMTDEELEVFGVDWDGLQDNLLLDSLRSNYAHEEGTSTWLGRHGPPENLNEVQVDPPSGPLTMEEIQGLDILTGPTSNVFGEENIVQLWCTAIIYCHNLYPEIF
ncbi:hypothetical protein EV361DRAFT_790771 [Lentinula raphanica]|nr:hypothetical protein EV361DRAFT_790771 [Lentinula raphanica]